MLTISAEDTVRALPFDALIDALRIGFRNGAHTPQRHHHVVDAGSDASVLLMPSWTDGEYLGVKLVNVFPGNSSLGRPALSSAFVLASATTGEHLAVVDGNTLTQRRTVATSALAATYLARKDSKVHVVVGAGHVGSLAADAYRSAFGIRQVIVHDHVPAHAQRLVDSLRERGVDADVATDLRDAVAAADIVTCATLATEPLIRGDWLREGTHLDLIGSFRPTMREADDECLRRGTVYIDTWAALEESGDLIQPIDAGVLDRNAIAGTLPGLCRGDIAARRDRDQITVFKSVGSGLADLAAAALVYHSTRNLTP